METTSTEHASALDHGPLYVGRTLHTRAGVEHSIYVAGEDYVAIYARSRRHNTSTAMTLDELAEYRDLINAALIASGR